MTSGFAVDIVCSIPDLLCRTFDDRFSLPVRVWLFL